MNNERIVRNAVAAAIITYAEREHSLRGEAFATDKELETIKSDPIGFADLLPRPAYDFLRDVLSAAQSQAPLLDQIIKLSDIREVGR